MVNPLVIKGTQKRDDILEALEAAAKYHHLEFHPEVFGSQSYVQVTSHQGDDAITLRVDLSGDYPRSLPVTGSTAVENGAIDEMVSDLQAELDNAFFPPPSKLPVDIRGLENYLQQIRHFTRDEPEAVILIKELMGLFDLVYRSRNDSHSYLKTLRPLSFIAADRAEFLAGAAVLAHGAQYNSITGERNWTKVFPQIIQRLEQGELTSVVQLIQEYRPEREPRPVDASSP